MGVLDFEAMCLEKCYVFHAGHADSHQVFVEVALQLRSVGWAWKFAVGVE